MVVFAIAISIFGPQGFWSPKSDTTPAIKDVITIPVVIDNTGTIELSGSLTTTGTVACAMDYNPVCGNDNQTYSNACMANTAGIVMMTEWECKTIELIKTGSENTGTITKIPTKLEDTVICTAEYAPVCGTNNQTYSNACLAGSIDVAHIGECDGTERKVFDTGSYQVYSNASLKYTFAMPKYAYYASAGSQDGATHTMAIATTASGVLDFATAPVQVWFYRTPPASGPSDQSMKTQNGILYIRNNDTTGNAKVTKIIQTVIESAK